MHYEPRGWAPAQGTADWFRDRCGEQQPADLVFFAGRYNDFREFLRGMERCGELLLADDSVSRVVSQDVGRGTGGEFRFVSKGAPVLLAGRKCLNGELEQNPPPFASRSLRDFCGRLKDMYTVTGIKKKYAPDTVDPSDPPWVDERTGLAYDTAKLFVDAIRKSGVGISRAQAWKTLREEPYLDDRNPRQDDQERCEDPTSRQAWPGATGCVDFRTSQVAVSKQMTVIYVDLSRPELPSGPTRAGQDPENDNGQPCRYVISGREPRISNDCLDPGRQPLSPTADD